MIMCGVNYLFEIQTKKCIMSTDYLKLDGDDGMNESRTNKMAAVPKL